MAKTPDQGSGRPPRRDGNQDESNARPGKPGFTPQRRADRSPVTKQLAPIAVDQQTQDAVGVSVDELTSLYILNSVKGLGPQTFKELHKQGVPPWKVIENPGLLPTPGKRGDALRTQLRTAGKSNERVCRDRASSQILAASKHDAHILTYKHPKYPPNVFDSNYPAPILFVRGSLDLLTVRMAVACVGSRKIRAPYDELEAEFVKVACRQSFTIVGGFALGADTIGHEQAWRTGGGTICVMPGGLERPFPPESKTLWAELLNYGKTAFVSEAGFGMRASALTLRKRNKLIVAFSLGVLVAQSAVDGGAMNAYRFALEMRKPFATFEADEGADISGNRSISKASGAQTFRHELPDVGAYEQWLRALSSLTSTERSGTASGGTPESWLI